MKTHQPAVSAHGQSHFAPTSRPDRARRVNKLEEAPHAERDKIPAACLAGFQRTFVFKRRFVPLYVSRLLARIR